MVNLIVQKRKLTIEVKRLKRLHKKLNNEIKRQNDTLHSIKDRVQSGKHKVDELNQQRKITKEINTNHGLPAYTGDYKPTKIKLSREDRINKSLNEVTKEEYNANISSDKKRNIYTRKALGDSFKEIIIDGSINMDKNIKSALEQLRESGGTSEYYKVLKDFFMFNKSVLTNIIQKELIREFLNHNSTRIKTNLIANIIFKYEVVKLEKSDNKTYKLYNDRYIASKTSERLVSKNQVEEFASSEVDKFIQQVFEYEVGPSGFTFHRMISITIQIAKSKVKRGGRYIELDKKLADKKAIINIKNYDDKCIKWCLLAYLHHDDEAVKKSKRYNIPTTYAVYEKEIIEPEDIKYPINIQTDIKKFEKANNIKINVFQYEENDRDFKNLVPIYNNRDRNTRVCNLLLIQDKSKEVEHLVWIKDLSKLKFSNNSDQHRMYWCSQCLNKAYETEKQLEDHYKLCFNHEAVRIELPKDVEKSKIKFTNHNNKFNHPFEIFLDFEATLQDYKYVENENDKGNQPKNAYQKHIPNSWGMKYNCIHNEYSESIQICNSSDKDSLLKNCIDEMERLAFKSYKLSKQNEKNKIVSDEELLKHTNYTKCQTCGCKFSDNNQKVLHHDHISGRYISTLCNDCNLKFKYKPFIPVYLHNLKNYDSHFLISALSKYGFKSDEDIISAIPTNEEKYISFSKKISVGKYKTKDGYKDIYFEIRFIDSFAFMAESLSKLVENLKVGCTTTKELREIFKYTSEHFKDDEKFLLMISKGIYPYEFINDYSRLNVKTLPPKDAFTSSLTNEKISEEDYNRALNVYDKFSCQTLLDYHNIYLNSDVLLLSDVWYNFKKTCLKIYDLDPSYYYTAPSLSWDAFLKHTNEEYLKKHNKEFELELLTDYDKYLFVENGIRGGLSQISKRYAKANNKYMSNYNESIIDSYILYLDANNLYGYAMSQYLPLKDFEWNNEEWTKEKIMNLKEDGKLGYIFEVDLHYPVELHDFHNGYPCAPETMKIKKDYLSKWQQEDYTENGIKKLVTSFLDKESYKVHFKILQLYLSLGLELNNVKRVLQFEQDDYMKSYIMKNTNERTKAKNEFEKNFYKLMNNSVFGKTMENVRNRINFKLVTSEAKALNIRNDRLRFTIFDEGLVGVHICKKQIILNKPIYIGMCVLDHSKYLMYDFHYNKMLKHFNRDNIDLLFTDTDSLCYHIRKQNPFEYMKQNKDLFDLSDYSTDHELYDKTNKKVIGKFKNESNDQIVEFVGLRSKLYSYCTETEESKKCKGVKKSVIKKDIRFEQYKQCLFSRQSKGIQQTGFRSYQHQIYTELISKVALSCRDDKCYIDDNNVTTKSIGHYKIYK